MVAELAFSSPELAAWRPDWVVVTTWRHPTPTLAGSSGECRGVPPAPHAPGPSSPDEAGAVRRAWGAASELPLGAANRTGRRRKLSRRKLREIREKGDYDERPTYVAANAERDEQIMEAWRHLRGAVNDEVLGDDEYWG